MAAVIFFVIHVPDIRVARTSPATFLSTMDSLDLPGFALFASFIIQFLLALQWGGSLHPWGSAIVIGLFCGSAGTFVLFGLWEYKRGDTAMFPLSMLQQRVVWCSCLTTLFAGANLLTSGYYISIYFQSIKGVTPTLAGVYSLPAILSQMLLAVVSGALGKFKMAPSY